MLVTKQLTVANDKKKHYGSQWLRQHLVTNILPNIFFCVQPQQAHNVIGHIW